MNNETLSILFNTFRSLVNGSTGRSVLEKAVVIRSAGDVFDSIANNTIPALEYVCESYNEEINNDKSGFTKSIYDNTHRIFKHRVKDVPSEYRNTYVSSYFIIKEIFSDLVNNKDKILSTLNNNLQQFIGTETTTIKDMTIINFLDCINYANNVCLDFIIYSIFTSSGEVKELHKNLRERVVSSTTSFFLNLAKLDMNNVNKFLKDLPKNSSIAMKNVEDSPVEDVASATKENGEHIETNGLDNFVGNPIYHVRLWIADFKHERYKQNLLKKEIILGKITQIRSGSVETYEKQSVVIDKLLTDLAEVEKKIVDYQKSVLD